MDISLRRRTRLSALFSLAGFAITALSVAPADAQKVTAGKGSVTIDLGVLNQLGPPLTPGAYPYGQTGAYQQPIYGQPVYGQYGYGQPAYSGYPAQPYGGLLFPPQQYPVSTLTVPAPAGSTPYVAPQPAMASTPPAAPATTTNASTAPAATSTTASTEMTPPPPPTPVETPTQPTPTTTGTTETTPAITGVATTGTDSGSTGTGQAASAPAAPAVPTVDTTGSTTTTDTTSTAGSTTAGTATTQGTAAATDTTGSATGTGQTQSASIPPSAPTEGQIRIAFPADSAEIPEAVKAQLDALAQKMATDDNMRVQLLAYASGTPETASRARRMSLSRALAVRSYLIKQGVRSTRMDVRALGNNVAGDPADRVDIIAKAQ